MGYSNFILIFVQIKMTRIMKQLLIPILLFALLLSCSAGKKNNETTRAEEKKRAFVLPEMPAMLEAPEARASFLARHFWDHFDFTDTTYIHLPDITEQALVNFMDLQGHVPQAVSELAIGILYGKASVNSRMLWYFWETMSRYWKDANSPLRNEEMFIRMCRSVEALTQVDEVLIGRATYARQLAEKNRVGEVAADFIYTLQSGKQGRLHELKAAYTLLFFYNPDCHTCSEIKQEMKASDWLKQLSADGIIEILTCYPDEDLELWKNHLDEMSADWINGYDKGQVITMEHLYDLSSIPSFYLLDKDKKVVLKDVDWPVILQFFKNKSL